MASFWCLTMRPLSGDVLKIPSISSRAVPIRETLILTKSKLACRVETQKLKLRLEFRSNIRQMFTNVQIEARGDVDQVEVAHKED